LYKNDSFPLQVSYLKKNFLDSCYKVTFPWTLKVAVDIFSRLWHFLYDYLAVWWVDCLINVCWYYLLTTLSLMCYVSLSFSFQIIIVYLCVHNIFYFNIWKYIHIYIYSYLLLTSLNPLFLILLRSFCKIHVHINLFYFYECRNFHKILFCPGKSQSVKQGV
jgi:hypothetical protein